MNIPFDFGGANFGTFQWGGPGPGLFDDALQNYLRNYLNDDVHVGDSYSEIVAIFNITVTQNFIILTSLPSPYKNIIVKLNNVVVSPTRYTVNQKLITFNFNLVNGNVVEVDYWR